MELQLRGELEIELEPDHGAGVLHDPLFGRNVGLGAAGVAVALALAEDPRELESLLAELAAKGFARERVEAPLRLFAMLHLLEGIGDNLRAKIRGIWAGGDELEYRQLDGARHACQGSGMCCRSYRLGPVGLEEADAIRALPLRDAMPDLPEGDLFGTTDGQLFFRTVDTHCVFLRDNNLCGLHAHFGEAAKPVACREYPITIKSTYRETLLYNNHQCASHFVALTRGSSLIDATRLTGKTTTGKITVFHPIVFAHEDTPVDYVQYVELESAQRAAIAAGPPLEQLAHAVTILDSFVAAARALPLGVDPAPHFAAWRGQVALAPASPMPAPTTGDVLNVGVLLDTLVEQVTKLLDDPTRANMDHDMVPLLSETVPILAALQLRVGKLVPGIAAAPLEEPLATALTLSLGQAFVGALSLPDDRPLAGIGQHALAIACAFTRAPERTVEALGRGHMLANRVLPPFTRVLFKKDPFLVRALVAVLPALVSAP